VVPVDDEGLVKPRAYVVVRETARERVADEAGRAALARELQQHVKATLSPHKYPRAVVFVDDLPRNDRGKVDRNLLKAGRT
jgi:acyl-coenzyme A synthetase/AMP-(fatty) acid ligase